MRVKSLKTVSANYAQLIKFLEDGIEKKLFDCPATANGFLKSMNSFEFLYLLQTCILIFERIEILNSELQKSDLNINESHEKVKRLLQSFKGLRQSGYDDLWKSIEDVKTKINVENAKLPRVSKSPKRFETPKDYYRKIYYEMIDTVIMSLEVRFESDTMNFLNTCENFTIGQTSYLSEIEKFYKNDFDYERLKTHRNMFLDIFSQEGLIPKSLKEVVILLKSLYGNRKNTVDLISEFSKFVKFLMTIPMSTCTAERSFSFLRFLKII